LSVVYTSVVSGLWSVVIQWRDSKHGWRDPQLYSDDVS